MQATWNDATMNRGNNVVQKSAFHRVRRDTDMYDNEFTVFHKQIHVPAFDKMFRVYLMQPTLSTWPLTQLIVSDSMECEFELMQRYKCKDAGDTLSM